MRLMYSTIILSWLSHGNCQVYDDDSDEKRSTNMNMGPRTWYQVPPRELRYPEVSCRSEKSHLRTFQKSKTTLNYILNATIITEFKYDSLNSTVETSSPSRDCFRTPTCSMGCHRWASPG